MRTRLVVVGVVVALMTAVTAGLGAGAASSDSSTPQFADWTALSGNVASGTLLGQSITLSGTHVWDPPVSNLDGTWPYFNGPDFTPPLPDTDEIQISGASPADSYTLAFAAPVVNPVLDVGSLGSRLDFPASIPIVRISGDSGFSVQGSSVIGTPNPNLGPDGINDSNGTVELIGTFQTITFTATYPTPGIEDGVLIQVGAAPPPPPPPPPPPTTTTTPTTPPAPPPHFPLPFPRNPFRPGTVDIHVFGIEVTQGIQEQSCACYGTLPSPPNPGTEHAAVVGYKGVTLAAGHFTVVRAFAAITEPISMTSLRGATASLTVLDSSGNQIAVWGPDSSPAALTHPDCLFCVSLKDRADPSASFNFLIPWQETEHRQLSFRVTVSPPTPQALGYVGPHQCPTCKGNTLTLANVPFAPTANVPVHPIPLTVGGAQTPDTVDQVFESAQIALPVNVQIFPYDTPLPVDGLNTAQAAAAVAKRASDDHLAGDQYPIGVFVDGQSTTSTGPKTFLGGLTLSGRTLFGKVPPISIARDDRPLTSAMHEIGHGLGLVHADTGSPSTQCPPLPLHADNCGPHPDGTPDCGGNSNGQPGGAWPPDNQGYIQGVGFDRRNWDIYRTGSSPSALVANFPVAGDQYYDFMSYCANTNESTAGGNRPDAWISVRNWTQLLGFHPPAQALPATAHAGASARARATIAGARGGAAGAEPVRVIATVDSAGNTSIFDVAPGAQADTPPTAGSPYRVELRSASGSQLASAVPSTTSIHIDGQRPGLLLVATLPMLPSAGSVAVSANGTVVANRSRSAHAPSVSWLSPHRGAHVGRGQTTLVRWREHDADGDRLTATIEYSADAGRDWKVVADRLAGDAVRVSNRLLSASRNARLRVRVSDGFNLTTALSGRLTTAGAPPVVTIIQHPAGRIAADTTVLLQGTAFDDAGRQLTGGHLRWFAGRKLIGRGALVTARGLPAGTRSVRLVATDGRGRSSQASFALAVRAVRAAFLVARAPNHLSPRARRLRITIATTTAAVLEIGGRRHEVGRRPRTLTIAVRPGRAQLRLRYSLRSAGGVIRGIYVVTR